MKGNDSNSLGIMVKRSGGNEFVSPTIYHETEDYYYISDEKVDAKDYILKPNSSEEYRVDTKTDELQGVYNVNKGYNKESNSSNNKIISNQALTNNLKNDDVKSKREIINKPNLKNDLNFNIVKESNINIKNDKISPDKQKFIYITTTNERDRKNITSFRF